MSRSSAQEAVSAYKYTVFPDVLLYIYIYTPKTSTVVPYFCLLCRHLHSCLQHKAEEVAVQIEDIAPEDNHV